MADRWGITINTETGELSYIPPPEPNDRAEMEHRVDIIEKEIQDLVVRAQQADDDLAAAIRVAAGQESVADLNQQLAVGIVRLRATARARNHSVCLARPIACSNRSTPGPHTGAPIDHTS
jgi:hypothetical protein